MTRNPFAMSVLAIVTLGHAALLYASKPAAVRPPQPLPLVAVTAIDLASTQTAAVAAAKPAPAKRELRQSTARQPRIARSVPPAPADSHATRTAASTPLSPGAAPDAGAAVATGQGSTAGSAALADNNASLVLPQYRGDYLHNPKPAYPPLSQELGEEGIAELKVEVSASGDALSVELARSSGYPRLDRAAREAVKRWRFIPARRGSQAIAHSFVVPVNFSLKSVQS